MTDFLSVPEVKVGAFYDPALAPDFGGSFFDLNHNKLVQLDIRDEDNELVPAWKFYEVLRPGTLILANVSLHCFVMKAGAGHRKVSAIRVRNKAWLTVVPRFISSISTARGSWLALTRRWSSRKDPLFRSPRLRWRAPSPRWAVQVTRRRVPLRTLSPPLGSLLLPHPRKARRRRRLLR